MNEEVEALKRNPVEQRLCCESCKHWTRIHEPAPAIRSGQCILNGWSTAWFTRCNEWEYLGAKGKEDDEESKIY